MKRALTKFRSQGSFSFAALPSGTEEEDALYGAAGGSGAAALLHGGAPAAARPSPLIYAIFVLLGVCLLSPWNIVINCLTFFQGQVAASDPMQATLPFFITTAFSYPGLPFLFIMIRYGSLVPTRTLVVGSCLLQAVCMALLPVLAPASPWAPVLLCACTGMATAVLQSSLMGLCSQFPSAHSQGFVLGQGVSGILASLGQITVQLLRAGGLTGNGPTYCYFAFAAALMTAGAGATLLLYTLPEARGYLLEASGGGGSSGSGSSGGDSELGGAAEAESARLLTREASSLSSSGSSSNLRRDGSAAHLEAPPSPSRSLDGAGAGASQAPAAAAASAGPSLTAVLGKAWKELASVFLVFFVTFLLFPNVIVRKPVYRHQLGAGSEYLASDGWWPTVLLALFNVADTVGRSLPAYPALVPIPRAMLLPCTLARLLVVPVIVGCVRQWAGWLGDLAVLLTLTVFAVSNGLLASREWAAAAGEGAGRARALGFNPTPLHSAHTQRAHPHRSGHHARPRGGGACGEGDAGLPPVAAAEPGHPHWQPGGAGLCEPLGVRLGGTPLLRRERQGSLLLLCGSGTGEHRNRGGK